MFREFMFNKNIKLIAFLVLIFLGLTGCQSQVQPASPVATHPVTDFLGRTVEVPVNVNRIGCLYAISGHAVTMLGKGQSIVAVVEGLKRDIVLGEINPQIAQAGVPKSGGTINIEELARLNPDVVFIQSSTAKNIAEVEKLSKFRIPTLVVDYTNMAEQQASIRMIGQAIGAEDKAEEYIRYFQEIIDRVTSRTKKIPMNQRVRVFHSVNEATRTDAANTLPADWLRAAGAINVSVNQTLQESGEKYYAGLEQILQWNPDVILVNEDGVDAYIRTNEHWTNLKAVIENKVYKMPNGISRWGHPGSLETPLALLWTAKILYPELFADVNMLQETKDFYQRFFNYSITDAAAKQILEGQGMREAKNSNG